jgi:hypothetical protein
MWWNMTFELWTNIEFHSGNFLRHPAPCHDAYVVGCLSCNNPIAASGPSIPCYDDHRPVHDASSFAFLLAALDSSAFFGFSACFRSITSTALFIPCFSSCLLRWQNSYIMNEPKTNDPTAQLQADHTVAI